MIRVSNPVHFSDDLVERVLELELTEPPQLIEPLREPSVEFADYLVGSVVAGNDR
jgi:hypothetical protein